MDLQHDDTITAPLRLGMDFDSDAFYLYLITATPSVELYLPAERRFQTEEGDRQTFYFLPEPEIERAAGEGSAYAGYMGKASAKIEKYLEAGITMPVTDYGKLQRSWMERRARDCSNTARYRSRLRGLHRKEDLKARVAEATLNVRVIDAVLRVFRRVALDLCALIGAVELPTWRAHGDLAGIVLYSGQIEGFSVEQHEQISLFERWGVPLWIAERCEQSSRYELDASSRPELGKPAKEKLHQQKLAEAQAVGLEVKETYLLEDYAVLPPLLGHWPATADELEVKMDDLILAALIPDENAESIPFDEFARLLEGMAGPNEMPVSWSLQKYEAGHHGDVEGRLWYNSRYYPFMTRNSGAVSACHAPPPHYHCPTLPFPLRNGRIPAPRIHPPTVPFDLWHCVEVRYFDNIGAMGTIMRFDPSILAYQAVRTQLSAAEGGFSEGPKPFVLQLWGKDKSALADATSQILQRRFLRKSFAETESTGNAALPSSWTPFLNLQYVALVLSSSRPQAVREGLMGLLPQLAAPPALHPEYKQLRVRYIHFLRHEILGGARWKSLTNRTTPHVQPQIMDCYEFSNNYLLNLISRPRPESLSALDFVEFHRLQIILEMLSTGLSFKIQLVPNSGPISRICSCIAEAIRRDVSVGMPDCKYVSGEVQPTPARMEGIVWVPGRKRFGLYLCQSNIKLRPLSLKQLEEWRTKEDNNLEVELAKKKHQPGAAKPSTSTS